MAVRWCCKPLQHINVVTPEDYSVMNWCLTRWEAGNPPQYLTVICLKLKSKDASGIKMRLLNRIRNLWTPPTQNMVTEGVFDKILDVHQNVNEAIENRYAILTAPLNMTPSFFEHLSGVISLIKAHCWIKDENTLNGDPDTLFKLHCIHVSVCHSVHNVYNTVCANVYNKGFISLNRSPTL